MMVLRELRRSRERAARASYLYVCLLVCVLYLYLPWGGYARMMEGKYVCFLALTLGYLAAMAALAPRAKPRMTAMRACAAAYLVCSAVSAACSPYGAAVLLGGTRRDGLVMLALYAALFFCLGGALRPDRRLIRLAAAAASLCGVLTLRQLAGGNPLGLYPAGTDYFSGDAAYSGFFAGVSGNIDFTAFLLAIAACVFAAALVRLRMWELAPALALTLAALWRLSVAAAGVGLAFAAVWSLALLVPRRRGAALAISAALSLCAAALVWRYDGANRTLVEASQLLHGGFDPSFGSSRLGIWADCLALARERPLFGGGPDTLWLRGIEPFAWFREGGVVPVDVTAAHNEYLNILVNQGALALAAYLALLCLALARCLRRAHEPRFALCGTGLLCYAAMACFSISTCITAPYVWTLFALVQRDEIDG